MTSDYELRSCVGKRCYPSGNAAAVARDHMGKKKRSTTGRGRGKTKIYKCEFCCGWHLGRPM